MIGNKLEWDFKYSSLNKRSILQILVVSHKLNAYNIINQTIGGNSMNLQQLENDFIKEFNRVNNLHIAAEQRGRKSTATYNTDRIAERNGISPVGEFITFVTVYACNYQDRYGVETGVKKAIDQFSHLLN